MSFINKIKEFYITVSLDENRAYIAGSTVEGKVIIDLTKSKRTTGPLRITLSGQAKVQWEQASALRTDAQTIFDDMTLYLWGTGSETLAAGKHEFPYTFRLPTDIPSSHEDAYGHIRYTLTTILPTGKAEVTRQKRIKVHGIVDVDRSDLLNSLNDSTSKTIGCWCCTSAPIELSASTDSGGYIRGETITIRESHGYRRITNIHATLLRKTVYHARTTESKFSCMHIVSVRYFTSDNRNPQVESIGRIRIPDDTVPSINCRILTVSYCVHVTLGFKLPMVKRLSIMIPVTIGNERSMAGVSAGSQLPNGPVQPTFTPTLRSLSNTLQRTPTQPIPAPHVGTYPVSDGVLQPIPNTLPNPAPDPVANILPTTVEAMLNTLTSAPMEPVVPSAPVCLIPNTLPIASAPTLSNAGDSKTPDTPPPLYSQF